MLQGLKKILSPTKLETKGTIKPIVFALLFNDKPIGHLSFEHDTWTFAYTPMAKTYNISPLSEFPDFNKKYTSTELWAFFSSRIPTSTHPEILSKKKKLDISKGDYGQLLKYFGERAISSPFVLKAT